MYSSEYEEEVNSPSDNSYKSNKKLVWIFIAIVLIIVVIVFLKNKNTSSNSNEVANNISIVIYPDSEIIITPDNTYRLTAVVDNNPNAVITWASSDENILKVVDGVVSAINYGKATITASYIYSDNKKYDAQKEITVAVGKTDIMVTDVSIEDGDLVMPIDGTYKIGLSIVPTNAYITNKVFTSSNEGVVTVDNKGNVKATGYGEAIITIDINNGLFNKELKVFVNQNYTNSEIVTSPNKIVLNKESTQIKIGETVKLGYTVIPNEAKNSILVWNSSDENVLSVDKNGIITAIKEGKATIKLSSINGISDSIDIEVIRDVVNITDINLPLNDIYIESGQSQVITPVVIPDTATDKVLIYAVSNENIIRVESLNEGAACLLTGVSEGIATLTIKSNTGEVSKMVNVTVGASTEYSGSSGSSSGSSCSKTCPNGQYVSDCKCLKCEAGNYCKDGKKTACSSGYTSKDGASSCYRVSCPAGQGLDSSATTGCSSCATGYVSAAGSGSCTKCASGTIPNASKSACVQCSSVFSVAHCTAYISSGNTCKCTSCASGYVWDGSKCNRVASACANRATVGECTADDKCNWNYSYGCRNK